MLFEMYPDFLTAAHLSRRAETYWWAFGSRFRARYEEAYFQEVTAAPKAVRCNPRFGKVAGGGEGEVAGLSCFVAATRLVVCGRIIFLHIPAAPVMQI